MFWPGGPSPDARLLGSVGWTIAQCPAFGSVPALFPLDRSERPEADRRCPDVFYRFSRDRSRLRNPWPLFLLCPRSDRCCRLPDGVTRLSHRHRATRGASRPRQHYRLETGAEPDRAALSLPRPRRLVAVVTIARELLARGLVFPVIERSSGRLRCRSIACVFRRLFRRPPFHRFAHQFLNYHFPVALQVPLRRMARIDLLRFLWLVWHLRSPLTASQYPESPKRAIPLWWEPPS